MVPELQIIQSVLKRRLILGIDWCGAAITPASGYGGLNLAGNLINLGETAQGQQLRVLVNQPNQVLNPRYGVTSIHGVGVNCPNDISELTKSSPIYTVWLSGSL